jgi:hypothetical protein
VNKKAFESITKDDIEALAANGISESRTLEYKAQLPEKNDEAVREFLADASSFANTGGGDLLYGMREKPDANGKPTGTPEAVGLANINPDAEELRLTNMLRDGIDPRIPGVRVQHIEGFPSGPVILLRIPKSWASPHMVKFKNASRFFSRTSAGKFQLDVREIRASFLASESIAEKIGAFRSDRLGKILSGETPIPVSPGPKLVLHLLPLRAFADPVTIDLVGAESSLDSRLLPMGPKANGFGALQFNFNGLLRNSGSGGSPQTDSYVQLFRSGAIEAVCKWRAEGTALLGEVLDQELNRMVPKYVGLQSQLEVGPPVFVAVSALSVKGCVILRTLNPTPFGSTWVRPINESVLAAPEVLLEEEKASLMELLRPAVNTIWQASGWPESPAYQDGEWVGFGRA